MAMTRLMVCHMCRGILVQGAPQIGYDQIGGLPRVQGHSVSRGS